MTMNKEQKANMKRLSSLYVIQQCSHEWFAKTASHTKGATDKSTNPNIALMHSGALLLW